ncbi:MAG: hypothetical protein ABIE75_03820 [Candidatus Omnitrophota bacterium]
MIVGKIIFFVRIIVEGIKEILGQVLINKEFTFSVAGGSSLPGPSSKKYIP